MKTLKDYIVEAQEVAEKSVSKAQQRFMGMVYDAKKGGKPASKEVAKAAKGMSKKAAKDFAQTKHKGLPNKVAEQGVAEGRVNQLPTKGADYSDYDTEHLRTLLKPGILHRNEARFKALIRKELKKREQQSQQGVAEGYPKHQDLSGISTDKLKAYLEKQSKQQVSGEGNQVKRVRAELQRREQGMAEAGNKSLEPHIGMGDSRTPRELKTQMRGASDEFVRSTADKKTGPFHSKVAKMQNKLAKSELRRREQGVAEGENTYMPSGEEIAGKDPKKMSKLDKAKQFAKKVANKVAPDDKTLMKDLINKSNESVTESMLIDESGETLDHILNRFKYEVKMFEQGADLDQDLYEALFDYYFSSGQMPYGTAKGRSGDPYEWVTEHLADELGLDEAIAPIAEPAVENDSLGDIKKLAGI